MSQSNRGPRPETHGKLANLSTRAGSDRQSPPLVQVPMFINIAQRVQKLSMAASSCRMFPARDCSLIETSHPCPVLYLIQWGSWLTRSLVPLHQVTYLTPGFLYLLVISSVSLFISSFHCPPAMVPGVKLWRKWNKIMWVLGLFGFSFHK